MVNERRFKLHELAASAGVPPRTVRYYVQRGLLSAPEFRGKDTTYGDEHLLRLAAIQRLQQCFLPLDAIEVALAGKSNDELARIAREGDAERVPVARPERPRDSRARAAPAPRCDAWELVPGLYLTLAPQASSEARALATTIVDECAERRTEKGVTR